MLDLLAAIGAAALLVVGGLCVALVRVARSSARVVNEARARRHVDELTARRAEQRAREAADRHGINLPRPH